MSIICFFFFFQAEDGIRDGHVTGVQTCALPICQKPHGAIRAAAAHLHPHGSVRTDEVTWWTEIDLRPAGGNRLPGGGVRSEERRVGKEWRSRGWGGD